MSEVRPGDRVRRIRSSMQVGPQIGQLGTVVEWTGTMSNQVWVRFDEMVRSPSFSEDCYLWPCSVNLIELVDPESKNDELMSIDLREIL